MIEADALAIHLNPLQEAIQPEGQTNFEYILPRIVEIAGGLDVPVIVKETGCGISAEDAKALESAGIKAIDVGGVGGTSFAAVEYYRSNNEKMMDKDFWDWGIPTVASIVEVANSTHLKVFASGGVRNGLHIAKAIALGAHYGGLALPMLKSAATGERTALARLKVVIEELRNALFLTGSRNLQELRKAPLVISGSSYLWLTQRGFDPARYATRRKS